MISKGNTDDNDDDDNYDDDSDDDDDDNGDDDDDDDDESAVSTVTPSNPKCNLKVITWCSWDTVHSGFPALLSCVCLNVTATQHRSFRPRSMLLIALAWKVN